MLLTYLISFTLNLLSLIPVPSPKAASDRPRGRNINIIANYR